MKNNGGSVLFLDRSDINTDEIIPAKYLTEIEKTALGPHLLEDLIMDGFNPTTDIQNKGVVVTRSNYGCGSSREHAPWALEVNGIGLVIAESFARIFRQNMYNGGMMAIELDAATIDHLFTTYANKETTIIINDELTELTVSADGQTETIPVSMSDFDQALVNAGGWVEYADQHY